MAFTLRPDAAQQADLDAVKAHLQTATLSAAIFRMAETYVALDQRCDKLAHENKQLRQQLARIAEALAERDQAERSLRQLLETAGHV